MRKIICFISLVLLAGFTACEDNIGLDVPEGKSLPVVDAWITTEQGIQSIRMTMSVPYADPDSAPVIRDAKIILNDLTTGSSYPFTFNNGAYTYDASAKPIGYVGHVYKIHIEYQHEILEGVDSLKRVPPVDSILFGHKTKEEAVSGVEGFYAKFFAVDFPGEGDYYWIRSYRNDTLHRVEDLLSIDGSLAGGISDGTPFILPLTQRITDYDRPFKLNETVIVRLSALSKNSYDFLWQVYQQLNAGGLFAKVLENVPTNIQNTDPKGKVKVLGWFGTSAVSRGERKIK
ncbi:DUF4249 domain-containing protein [Chitinophaga sp. Cy-1792]|uniref:DUF4249 domain-containing protein n=1 Tax=Chitinophaga sp. Cy-1792 TaxID=2608339 RepID=UPI0014245EF9|nr:DUF4249 domain-containing protein [Chitinophaga sp. Cy-1792]NIG54386.1 DUF4249 domain-containing protein [Chitinophaga sp. Cy-1792]